MDSLHFRNDLTIGQIQENIDKAKTRVLSEFAKEKPMQKTEDSSPLLEKSKDLTEATNGLEKEELRSVGKCSKLTRLLIIASAIIGLAALTIGITALVHAMLPLAISMMVVGGVILGIDIVLIAKNCRDRRKNPVFSEL